MRFLIHRTHYSTDTRYVERPPCNGAKRVAGRWVIDIDTIPELLVLVSQAAMHPIIVSEETCRTVESGETLYSYSLEIYDGYRE